jgi:hypothetical protein
MPLVYKLDYRNGRSEDLFAESGYFYVLGEEALLSFDAIPAWCHACESIVPAEELMTPEQIQADLSDIDNPSSPFYSTKVRPSSGDVEFWRQHLANQRMLLDLRKSPPRCLRCGLPRVSYFPFQWSPHPATGEEVRFYGQGVSSQRHADDALKFFSPDGKRCVLSDIERDHFLSLIKGGKAKRL